MEKRSRSWQRCTGARAPGRGGGRHPPKRRSPGRADSLATGWQASREGDRTVKFEIRKAFKKFGLEPTGELFDHAYAYVAEHY